MRAARALREYRATRADFSKHQLIFRKKGTFGAGAAVNAPKLTDGDLSFPDLNSGNDPNTGASGAADEFQTNLIMPEPTLFLSKKLGPVAIIRPTSDEQGGAVASVVSFAQDGLFLDPATNRNTGIVDVLMRLAEEADEATRRI